MINKKFSRNSFGSSETGSFYRQVFFLVMVCLYPTAVYPESGFYSIGKPGSKFDWQIIDSNGYRWVVLTNKRSSNENFPGDLDRLTWKIFNAIGIR